MRRSIEIYVWDGGGVHYHLLMKSEDDLSKSLAFLNAATRDGNFNPTGEPYYVATRVQLAALAQARKTWNRDKSA